MILVVALAHFCLCSLLCLLVVACPHLLLSQLIIHPHLLSLLLLVVATDNLNTTQTLEYTKDKYNCKGNLTNLRRELHLSLAKGNPK
jgi:hypothetical protein